MPDLLPAPPDRCPRCVGHVVAPFDQKVNGGDLVSGYACPGCGHRWIARRTLEWVGCPAGGAA